MHHNIRCSTNPKFSKEQKSMKAWLSFALDHYNLNNLPSGFPCSAHQHFSEVQSGLMAVFPGSLQERRLQPQLAIVRLKMTKLLMSSLRECFHKFELNHCFYTPKVPTLFLTTMVN